MATTSADMADMPMPENESSYMDYLKGIPIGASMEMDLMPDVDELEEEEQAEYRFVIKRRGDDEWEGVPFVDSCDTDALFAYVVAHVDGDEFIRVSHGKDPRTVKKEKVDCGEDDTGPTFFTINEKIDLTNDDDDDSEPSPSALTRTLALTLSLAPTPTLVLSRWRWGFSYGEVGGQGGQGGLRGRLPSPLGAGCGGGVACGGF